MSAISGSEYFHSASSSTGTSGEAEAPKSHRLFTWGTAAVSVGVLAAGGLLAAYCSSPSDENSLEGNSPQTALGVRATSLAQDMALFVSAGIMPFFGLLGASFHVFREEQNRIRECYQNSERKVLIENLTMYSVGSEAKEIPDASKLIDLARESYDAGCLDEAESLIQRISQEEDRNDLCEELAKESDDAGRFGEAEKFIKLMSHGQERGWLCGNLAKKHYKNGRLDQVERFIQLMPSRQMRNSAFKELTNQGFYLGRFDEAEKFVRLISTQPSYDWACKNLAERSDYAGHFDQTKRFIQLIQNSEDRNGLLEKLAQKNYWAGRLDQAIELIQLMDKRLDRLELLTQLERKSTDAGQVDEALKFTRLLDEDRAMGHAFLDDAILSCRSYQLDKAALSLRSLTNSYDPSKYSEIDELAEKCFDACKMFSWTEGKSADQKYLEFVSFIPNVPLRELLQEKLKDVRPPDLIPDCMDSENCPVLDLELVPSRAIEAVTFPPEIEVIPEGPIGRQTSWNTDFEMLRFRQEDPREKALFAVAAEDHNGALKPLSHERVLRLLDSKYDLKYQILSKEETLCEAIQSGAKTGRLSRIYMLAHGLPTSMQFGRGRFGVIHQASNISSCFSGLPEDLVITLLSCLTGSPTSDGSDPFAQTMADKAKKTVIAATETIYTSMCHLSYSEELFHPSESDDSKNSFVIFHPREGTGSNSNKKE